MLVVAARSLKSSQRSVRSTDIPHHTSTLLSFVTSPRHQLQQTAYLHSNTKACYYFVYFHWERFDNVFVTV